MRSVKSIWQTAAHAVLKALRVDIDERNRALNSKVDTRQTTRAWLRDEAYKEMRMLKVPRKVQRYMARDKAKRQWQERNGTE